MNEDLKNLTVQQLTDTVCDLSAIIYELIRKNKPQSEIDKLDCERTRILKEMVRQSTDYELQSTAEQVSQIRAEYEVLQYDLRKKNEYLDPVMQYQLDTLNRDMKTIIRETKKRQRYEDSH